MGLIFNWKPQAASTPTNAIPSPSPRLDALSLPRDHRAHPRGQPPRTPGSPGLCSGTAAAAAPLPACAHRAPDFLLWLLLLLLLGGTALPPPPPPAPRPAPRAELLSAPRPSAGRSGECYKELSPREPYPTLEL